MKGKELWGGSWRKKEQFRQVGAKSHSSKPLHRGSSGPWLTSWASFSRSIPQSGRRQWHPTPVLLSGKPHGQRSLVGCSLWGREESDMTERLHFHFSLSCIGEGNGNPLQCSCLENPRDGGAWWADVYGVAQSRTRLKRRSSSSSTSQYYVYYGETAKQLRSIIRVK